MQTVIDAMVKYIEPRHPDVDIDLIRNVLEDNLVEWRISRLDKADAKPYVEKIITQICEMSGVQYPFRNGALPAQDDEPIERMFKGVSFMFLPIRLEDEIQKMHETQVESRSELEQQFKKDLDNAPEQIAPDTPVELDALVNA